MDSYTSNNLFYTQKPHIIHTRKLTSWTLRSGHHPIFNTERYRLAVRSGELLLRETQGASSAGALRVRDKLYQRIRQRTTGVTTHDSVLARGLLRGLLDDDAVAEAGGGLEDGEAKVSGGAASARCCR